MIVGLSHFLPGGGAGPDASPTEKVYFVLAGELTLIVGGKETVAEANDSCFIGPNESRELVNRGNDVCTMLVAIAPPSKSSVMPSLTRPYTASSSELWMPAHESGHDEVR